MGGIWSKWKARNDSSKSSKKTDDRVHSPTNESGCVKYGYPEPETEPSQTSAVEVPVTSEIQPEFYCSEEPCCTKQSSTEAVECGMLAIASKLYSGKV